MKHLKEQLAWNDKRLKALLADCGILTSLEQCGELLHHAELVLAANKRMNLTRITNFDEFVVLHVVDSLTFLTHVEEIRGRVLDLGSGAGFPGIPLAIMGYEVALCEATQKKARFLEEFAEKLSLSVLVHSVRAEELAHERPHAVDVVVSRAVSSLAALVELSAPLLRDRGRLIALKGKPENEEIERAHRAARLCGMKPTRSESYALPTGEVRSVYEYTRVDNPGLKLPRRPGMAQRQPLG